MLFLVELMAMKIWHHEMTENQYEFVYTAVNVYLKTLKSYLLLTTLFIVGTNTTFNCFRFGATMPEYKLDNC